MTPLNLLPFLFAFTYASVDGGDTRNLVDYYFNYENDGAFCDGNDRSLLLDEISGELSQGLALVIGVGEICGLGSGCLSIELQEFIGISSSCASCFIDFISDATLTCEAECFGVDEEDPIGESACRDCLETFNGFDEIEFENCVGLDFIRDDEVETCVGQLNVADEFFDLPKELQRRFNDNCKGEQDPDLVQGANCLTSDIFLNFGVDEDCADCLRDHAICINQFCSDTCEGNDDLSACIECVENSQCAADFNSCSGLNFYNIQDEEEEEEYVGEEEDYVGNNSNEFYDEFYYYNGAKGFFETISDFFNDFFATFIGEFINSLVNFLRGQ